MEANVAQQTISCIERGRNEPSVEITRALAKAFRVSPLEIMGESEPVEDKYSSLENDLIEIFRKLNDSGKSFLLQQAENILQQPSFRKEGFASSAV